MDLTTWYKKLSPKQHRLLFNCILVNDGVRPAALLENAENETDFLGQVQDLFPDLEFKIKLNQWYPPASVRLVSPGGLSRPLVDLATNPSGLIVTETYFVMRVDNEYIQELYETSIAHKPLKDTSNYNFGTLLGYFQPSTTSRALRELKYNLVLTAVPGSIPIFSQKVDDHVSFNQITELLDQAQLSIKQYLPNMEVIMITQSLIASSDSTTVSRSISTAIDH